MTPRLIEQLHLREPWEVITKRLVPQHRHSFWYLMGSVTLTLLVVQLVSGVLLMLVYEPGVDTAHASVRRIVEEVPSGWLVRSVHVWTSHLLILMVFVHMTSAFLMKAYRPPRRIVWVTGSLLLILALGFGFTGYLLPWDETAYFGTMIGSEIARSIPLAGESISNFIRGGASVGAATLTRMYAMHVSILPLILIGVLITHLATQALSGFSVPRNARLSGEIRYFPDHILKVIVASLVALAAIVALAVLSPSGLGTAYNVHQPTEPPPDVHPAWYFMFLYQLLRVIPAPLAVSMVLVAFVLLASVPWLDKASARNERSPYVTALGILFVLGYLLLTAIAYAGLGP